MSRRLRAELLALALLSCGCGGDLTRDAPSARFSVVHATGEHEDYVVPSDGVKCSVGAGFELDLHPSLSHAYPRLWVRAKPFPTPTEHQVGWAPKEGEFYSELPEAKCTLHIERYASPSGQFDCLLFPDDIAIVAGEFACGDDLRAR